LTSAGRLAKVRRLLRPGRPMRRFRPRVKAAFGLGRGTNEILTGKGKSYGQEARGWDGRVVLARPEHDGLHRRRRLQPLPGHQVQYAVNLPKLDEGDRHQGE